MVLRSAKAKLIAGVTSIGIVLAVALLQVVPRGGDGEGRTVEEAGSAALAAQFFTINVVYESQSPDWPSGRSRIYYKAPDSWHIVDELSGELDDWIIIGGRAWERRNAGSWRQEDPEAKRQVLKSLMALNSVPKDRAAEPASDGPDRDGEPTKIWRRTEPRWGETVAAPIATMAAEHPSLASDPEVLRTMQTLGGVEWRARVVVGERTSRVYEVIVDLVGPNLSARITYTFDYETPVDIRLP